MTDADQARELDELDGLWLNDRSEFQQNFVHGLRNPIGLHIQYRLEERLVVGDWTADERHVGFPGVVHGGLLAAILDDVMGRWSAMRHRWVVTARMETRFRVPAPVGVALRIEAWVTRERTRTLQAESRILLPDGVVVVEATATYLAITGALRERMVAAWPGFAGFA